MKALLVLLCALLCLPAMAGEAVPTAVDPMTAKRSVQLAEQLRCLVCQNQSIAESHAELAIDLRRQIDEQIKAGRSDREIIDFMVQRYGDFVLYKPPFKAQTALLWIGPAVLAVLGLGVLGWNLRARSRTAAEKPLSDADRAEAERLLAGATAKDGT